MSLIAHRVAGSSISKSVFAVEAFALTLFQRSTSKVDHASYDSAEIVSSLRGVVSNCTKDSSLNVLSSKCANLKQLRVIKYQQSNENWRVLNEGSAKMFQKFGDREKSSSKKRKMLQI